MGNKCFHELSQDEINTLISEKRTIGYVMDNYKQPDWCAYPNALNGHMGCWSLMDLGKDGTRTKISESFCANCDSFKKKLTHIKNKS